jgi:O-antigen/teichoic acid export membrane protein
VSVLALPSLRHVRSVPMLRDGYALALNAMVTAVVGLVYWTVAAHVYDQETLGVNSALISAMMFVAGLATLNLPNILIRFLGEARSGARRLIVGSYVVCATLAVVGAGIAVLTGALPKGGHETSTALAVAFVASCCIWTVFVLQDGALTGLGRAVWVPVENGAFAVVKLGLLLAFAGTSAEYGLFASWVLGVLVTVIVVNLALLGRVVHRHDTSRSAARALVRTRRFARYLALDWVCATSWLASTTLLPVIVTAVLGPRANASFALAWALAFPLYMVASSIGSALVLHGGAAPEELAGSVRRSMTIGALVLLPAVLVLAAGAPLALRLFGANYGREASGLLRLLALGVVPNFVVVLWVSAARAQRRLGGAVAALGGHAVITLALLVPLLHARGVEGAGVAWLTGMTFVAGGVLVAAVRRDRPGAAVARRARALVGDMPLRGCPTDSDTTVLHGMPEEGPAVIVKLAGSAPACVRLERHRAAVERLRGLENLETWRRLLPVPLSAGDGWLVESALAGRDGRDLPEAVVLEGVAAAMAPLYGAARGTLDAGAIRERLQAHGATVARLAGRAAPALLERLEASVGDHAYRSGWVHGDLWPGNVLFAPGGTGVTGIIDWEAARADGVPAVDLAHLVVCLRAHASGRGFGSVAARLADGRDELSAIEREVIDAVSVPGAALPTPLLAELAWFEHVVLRSAQVGLHARGLWARRTVRPLLGDA